MIVQPINRAPRYVFRHSLHAVVKSPAIPAIQVAFVFDKEIRRDGMKFARQDTRTHVWKQPAPHLAVNIFTTPLPLFGRLVGAWILQTLRILRERRLR